MALHKVGAIGWFDAVHGLIESCIHCVSLDGMCICREVRFVRQLRFSVIFEWWVRGENTYCT
jgi:hypothetical protein